MSERERERERESEREREKGSEIKREREIWTKSELLYVFIFMIKPLVS